MRAIPVRPRPILASGPTTPLLDRINEAVRMDEEAFTSELAQLISHLTERLSGREDGKPRIFRDSAIGNLQEFFERFQDLNVRSNEELDRLDVAQYLDWDHVDGERAAPAL